MSRLVCSLLVCFILLGSVLPAAAQERTLVAQGDAPKYEFRGAWIATVINLDWPDSRFGSTQAQQVQLITMLDALQEAGINAVFFQVRSESDAMYASDIEPWSHWLTGTQGQAPNPFYDPLSFAIEEAHKRGMELHAWLNPYRANRGSGYPTDPSHVTNAHPDWTLSIGDIVVLDPGLQEVRDYIATIVSDVARRYDIDGVHFDDYFYPYPPNQITGEDAFTFSLHPRGFTNIGDWRRDNVNLMVAQVHDSLQVVNPSIKFGISPFGIWKNGVPNGIVGLDAYNDIYSDARAWIDAETIDYIVPQLYWSFGGGQDYGKLAPWWESVRNDRHFYPGHGLYRADAATYWSTLFAADEIPRQVRFNRNEEGIQGSVFFRAKNITVHPSKGFADTLRTDLYKQPALTPSMRWKDATPPATPPNLAFEWTSDEEVRLSWETPPATGGEPAAKRYAVYRVRSAAAPNFDEIIADAANLIALTGENEITDRPGIADDPYYYVVTSVSANSIESAPSNHIVLDGKAVDVEHYEPTAIALLQNYPNPFRETTTIQFTLDTPRTVSLRIYNMLGQEVATLLTETWKEPGVHQILWEGVNHAGSRLPSGAYFYILDTGDRRETKNMLLVR